MVKDRSVIRLGFTAAVGLLLASASVLMAEPAGSRSGELTREAGGSTAPVVVATGTSHGPPVPRPSNMVLDQASVAPPAARPEGSLAESPVEGQVGGAPIGPPSNSDKEIVRRAGPEMADTQAADQRPIGRRGSTGFTWSFLNLWPMLVVLVLILGAAWFIKRFLPNRRLFLGEGALKIVARTPISPKQSLMLVKVGGRLVMIGVSPERIGTLAIIDDRDQVALLLGEVASTRPDSLTSAFDRSFRAEAEAYQPEPVAAEEALDTEGQVQGLLNKIRRLTGRQTVS